MMLNVDIIINVNFSRRSSPWQLMADSFRIANIFFVENYSLHGTMTKIVGHFDDQPVQLSGYVKIQFITFILKSLGFLAIRLIYINIQFFGIVLSNVYISLTFESHQFSYHDKKCT